MQAETGSAPKHLIGRNISFDAGEFDPVAEGPTQALFALKGQHLQPRVAPLHAECVAAVVEEGAQFNGHDQASRATDGDTS